MVEVKKIVKMLHFDISKEFRETLTIFVIVVLIFILSHNKELHGAQAHL